MMITMKKAGSGSHVCTCKDCAATSRHQAGRAEARPRQSTVLHLRLDFLRVKRWRRRGPSRGSGRRFTNNQLWTMKRSRVIVLRSGSEPLPFGECARCPISLGRKNHPISVPLEAPPCCVTGEISAEGGEDAVSFPTRFPLAPPSARRLASIVPFVCYDWLVNILPVSGLSI